MVYYVIYLKYIFKFFYILTICIIQNISKKSNIMWFIT
jgi:hypothetical protein